MTVLSVNINKIALIRNSRGGNVPNVKQIALDCERFGAQGITVHPRPDERHIRYRDVGELKDCITTELNVEGYPSKSFMDLVCSIKPAQVTLVPDPPEALTSNQGWNTIENKKLLKDISMKLQDNAIRVSIFVDPQRAMIEAAKEIGVERIELFTEPYALAYPKNKALAVADYVSASQYAHAIGLEVNAGHDLSLENLRFFAQELPVLHEVSIGHALVSDALYYGLEKTIQLYRDCLKP